MVDIIQFPSEKIVRNNPPDPEILETTKRRAILQFAENIVEEIMQEIEGYILSYGLEEKDETAKDKIYLLETVRATIYRSLDIEHPLHEHIIKAVEQQEAN